MITSKHVSAAMPFHFSLCLQLLSSCLLVMAVMTDVMAAETTKPTYRMIAGKGYAICEAYLRNLRAFGAGERDPVCAPRPHPGSKDIAEPQWKVMDVWKNLQMVYDAEMKWGIYLNHPERHLPYETWRNEFEAKTKSGEIHPSLKRADVEFVKGKLVTIVAYARDLQGCEGDFARDGASDNTGHRLFFYDEKTGSLKRDEGSAGLAGAILLFRKRPFIVNTVSTAQYIYLYETPERNLVYAPTERCRYDVDDPTKPASLLKQRPFSK